MAIKQTDKCSKCSKTNSKMFWDYKDGTMLCDNCEKEYGAEWEKDHSEIKSSTKSGVDTKMSGWLKFFIVTLVLSCLLNIYLGLSDISSVIGYLNQPNSFNISLLILADIVYFGGIILSFGYAAYLLYNRKNNAVPFTKLALIIFVVSTIIIAIWLKSITPGPSTDTTYFRSLGYGAIWFWYLNGSKNVQEVFPKNSRKLTLIDYLILIIPIIGSFLIFGA